MSMKDLAKKMKLFQSLLKLPSRQVRRQQLRARWYKAHRVEGYHRGKVRKPIDSRQSRRGLARAFAASDYRAYCLWRTA